MCPSFDPPEPAPSGGEQAGVPDHARWIAAMYAELRALAQSELNAERPGHTLSATALVNEVYLKLARGTQPDSGTSGGTSIDRGTFFGLAAQAMRRILVDHARGKLRLKRGGGRAIGGSDAIGGVGDPQHESEPMDAAALDEALSRLAVEHEQAARVVELRFFAGLPEKTIADCLGINERTVRRHWTFAKAWLARDMGSEEPSCPESGR